MDVSEIIFNLFFFLVSEIFRFVSSVCFLPSHLLFPLAAKDIFCFVSSL